MQNSSWNRQWGGAALTKMLSEMDKTVDREGGILTSISFGPFYLTPSLALISLLVHVTPS